MNKYDRGNEKFKPFIEYRHKDYRTPRSMKEAYGYESDLHIEEQENEGDTLVGIVCLIVFGFLIGLFAYMSITGSA